MAPVDPPADVSVTKTQIWEELIKAHVKRIFDSAGEPQHEEFSHPGTVH